MTNPELRLGTSTYSYWHFTPETVAIETIIDEAAKLGLAGVEILQQQMESEDIPYLQKLKRHAFHAGMDIYNLGTQQDFVWADAEERQRQVNHTLMCIDIAHELGVPSIRVNSGGWRKEGSFDGLIAAKGRVDPLNGYTNDDGFKWCIDAIEACLSHAERRGVMLLLENHWGLTTTAKGMTRIIESVDSPWLRAILDMGNFIFEDDMYAAMQTVAPYAWLAHAKTYPGGGSWYTLDLDFARIFRMLLDVGFAGYVSIEMEGQETVETAMLKSAKQLQEAWNAALER